MFPWLLILLSYLPLQIALNPEGSFDLASIRVFIPLLFVVWFFKGRIVKWFNWQSICLLSFLLLSLLSLTYAGNVSWGARKIIYFLSIFPIYFLALRLIDDWSRITKVFTVLFGSAIVVSFIGLAQFAAQAVFGLERVYNFWAVNILPVFSGFNLGSMILVYPSWLVEIEGAAVMRAFSVFSDPHIFSFYIGLILPSLALWLNHRYRSLILGGYALLFFALLCTFTRGAYLAFIAVSLVLAVLLWKYLRAKKTAVLICIPLLIFILPLTPFSGRFYSSFDLNEGSNLGRLDMWMQAARLARGHWWQGVGLGSYALSLDARLDYRNPATAHNLYLDIFSELGLLGLIIWLVLIFSTIGRLLSELKRAKDQRQRCLLISLIGSMTYFAGHSFFETALYSPVVLSVWLVLLALSMIALNYRRTFRN